MSHLSSSLAQESHTLRSNQHFVRTSFFETYNTVPMCKSLSPPAESPIIIKLSGLLLLSACSYTGVLFNIEFLYHSYWKFFPYKLSSLFHVLLQITTCILLQVYIPHRNLAPLRLINLKNNNLLEKSHFKKDITDKVQKKFIEIKFSGKSDYMYILFLIPILGTLWYLNFTSWLKIMNDPKKKRTAHQLNITGAILTFFILLIFMYLIFILLDS